MKRLAAPILVSCLFVAGTLEAQEDWAEGPVWEIAYYRTAPGRNHECVSYLRSTWLPLNDELKRQGVILDFKVFVKAPSGPDDWDIGVATLHKSFASLDYSADAEAKKRKAAEKQFRTADEEKQRDATAVRLAWRTHLRTELVREVTLQPMR